MAYVDITGQKFGRLTALRPLDNGSKNKMWLCKCDCGNYKEAYGTKLRYGHIKSCGCLQKDKVREIVYKYKPGLKHGGTHERLFTVWNSAKKRCETVSSTGYPYYGGRGIKMCDEWRKDYGAFRDWALANGYDDKAKHGECTLDRIDVNGNYEPSNCRWISIQEQSLNTRRNHYLTYNGEKKTVSQWAKQIGAPPSTMYSRSNRGWSDVKVIETAIKEANERLL